ncbi:MAG: CatB-related O-acetyltransferase [Syntrophomonas sp.]
MYFLALRLLFGDIRRRLILALRKANWRKKNYHNETYPENIFPLNKVSVGRYTYGGLRVYTYRNPNEKLAIGDFCSIASDVVFILSGEHNYRKILSYPIEEKFGNKKYESYCKGPIIIEDDVWIGARSTILSGVRIGKGSIVGAGSIVAVNVPPYSIFVNGRVIKHRFKEEICQKLYSSDFSKIDSDVILNNYKLINQNVSEENIIEILRAINSK